MKSSILAAVLTATFFLVPIAHAQAGPAPVGNPETDTLQLWASITSSIEVIAQEAVSAAGQFASAIQELALAASPHSSQLAPQVSSERPQPASLASAIGSLQTAEEASSSTTSSQPAIQIADASLAQPIIERITEYEPISTNGFVTQGELTSQLQVLSDTLAAKFNTTATPPLSENVLGDGNPILPYAAENAIDNLNNVTITNANLTASEIPGLDYLSLSGGTLAGNLLLNGNATTTGTSYYTGNVGIGTSTSDVLAVDGSEYLADITPPTVTANRLYSSGGDLYWAGSVVSSSAIGHWTSDGTNAWRLSGDVGIGTSSPFAALSVVGNGYFTGALSAASINAVNATTTNATSTNLFATFGNFTNGLINTLSGTTLNYTAASTTNFSNSGTAYFGATGTTTIDSAGDLNVGGSLSAVGNVTLGSATSTNFFAAVANFTSGLFNSLSSSIATITNLTATNATSTNATSTNLYVSNRATIGSLTGFLKAVSGVIATSTINLTSDVSGILPLSGGGTGTSSATGAASNIQFLVSTSTGVARSLQNKLSDTISVKDFGAAGNALTYKDGTIGLGSNAFSSASATFTAADVGKTIWIDYAGTAGAPLQTTITGFTDAHDVTLAADAATAVPYSFLFNVFVATAQSGSGSYAPGDTITLSGGTAVTPAVLTVERTEVVSASLVSGGTGGTTTTGATSGSCVVTGTTGTGERKVSLNVTLSSGVITSITSIASNGQYSANPTSLAAEPVTGCGSLSGATVSPVMGVLMPIVTTPGDYTATAATLTQSSTSGSGTGATFTPGFVTGGTYTYGTDDTQAWTNAINYEMQLDKAGMPVCIYAPAGIYLISSPLPTFTTNGCITGASQNETFLSPAPSLSGDLLSWSDAWADGASPFGDPNYVTSQQKTGPTIENIGIDGDLSTTNVQNAIAFRDREDNINLNNVEVDNMHGSCMTTGYTKNTTQSFIRESTIENFRCYNSGTASHPAIDMLSTGGGIVNNEIEMDNIDIYAPNGPGLAFRNGAGQIRIGNLRIEGQEGDPQLTAGDLLDIGSASYSGIENNITIDNLELVNPYLGYAAMRMTADSAQDMPYYITVLSGHLTAPSAVSYGRGLEIDAGRNLSFKFTQLQTNDYNVYVGAAPLVGSNILISNNGSESSLYTYIDPTSVKSVTLPGTWQTLASLTSGGANNTSSGLNALASLTTGSSDTAFGYNAGNALSSGLQNVFLGAFAGQVHSSGSGDTYLGYNAGQGDTVGFGNTCVGSNACYQNTNGDDNTTLGTGAGYKLGIGSYANIIIGLDNATDVNQPQTDKDTIVIGDQLSALPNNAYAQLDIGNLIFATGLASTSALSTGNVGIASTSPATNFSVGGNGYFTGGLGVGLLNTGAGTLQTSGNATIGGALIANGATSTFANGLTINAGCIYLNGGCLNTSGITNYWTSTGANLYNNTGTNLGVGTSTPWATLSVQAPSNSSSPQFVVASSSAFSLLVAGNGDVGIGTSSPMSTLALNAGQIAVPNGATAAPSYSFGSALNSGWYSAVASDIRLSVNGTDRFRSTGGDDYFNVVGSIFGTETITPSNILSVYGNASVGTSYATTTAPTNGLIVQGNVGIGTTSPSSRLEVWGPDTASTSAFMVANNASTTEFSVLDNGNATLSGNLIQNSDQRLKTNVQSLDASSSLAAIDSLNPVTFNWIDPNKGTSPQLGFIAQQVLPVFPNLISTTSATILTPDGTLSLNYIGLISPIVSAIQALSSEVTSIENAIEGFAMVFHTQELCVGSTCIDQQQLAAVLAAANASQSSGQGNAGSSGIGATTTPTTPPIIKINGDNPAIVEVGETYEDLGATITGPLADLNLGITTYLNGVQASPSQINTSAAATDTVDYVVSDQNGLTSTSTRTVIIEPSPSIVPTENASTTVDDAGADNSANSENLASSTAATTAQ